MRIGKDPETWSCRNARSSRSSIPQVFHSRQRDALILPIVAIYLSSPATRHGKPELTAKMSAVIALGLISFVAGVASQACSSTYNGGAVFEVGIVDASASTERLAEVQPSPTRLVNSIGFVDHV